MTTPTEFSTKRLIAGILILAGCIVVAVEVAAFPGTSPPGFGTQPPSQPPTPFIPPRQVDDQRFVQPSRQAQQQQSTTSGAAGGAAAAGGLAGGSSGGFSGGGFSGFGGTGGGGGFFFGQGRMARLGGNQADANRTFHGSFNFGGFKGYGFGGGDMSSWYSHQRPALGGAASQDGEK